MRLSVALLFRRPRVLSAARNAPLLRGDFQPERIPTGSSCCILIFEVRPRKRPSAIPNSCAYVRWGHPYVSPVYSAELSTRGGERERAFVSRFNNFLNYTRYEFLTENFRIYGASCADSTAVLEFFPSFSADLNTVFKVSLSLKTLVYFLTDNKI